MGLALIIPGADFSASNIGTVTPSGNVPITGLAISGPDSVNGMSASYSAVFTPSHTTEREVTWSVVSGSAYASISNSGALTVLPGASSNSVTIRVTSATNTSVYGEKTIVVTYAMQSEVNLYDLTITAGERYPDGTIKQNGNPMVWGTITDQISVLGVASIDPTVPSGVSNFIIEAIYFDSNGNGITPPYYLYATGAWANRVTVNKSVPSNASYVYINLAVDGTAYSPTLSDGVSLTLNPTT